MTFYLVETPGQYALFRTVNRAEAYLHYLFYETISYRVTEPTMPDEYGRLIWEGEQLRPDGSPLHPDSHEFFLPIVGVETPGYPLP